MYIGVDFYPEHWDRKHWGTYAKQMHAAGFNVVRLAEFAWVMLEPEEGVFDFTWLDDAIAVLKNQGISVILGTPTGAMPAWVARKYPETLAMKHDGTRIVWGTRKNNCFSSGTYRLLSERITRAMAEHYAGNDAVIGWQTDNEFGHPDCCCPSCRSEFQAWLKQKYKTLAALNGAWGTRFWGHSYGSWEEIVIPDAMDRQNPSTCLDWKRFVSHLNVRFQHEQVVIIRTTAPQHFITHNFMGYFSELDYYDLAKDLDFVSWDNYPVWGKPGVRYDASGAADVMRGLKKKNFWIMEQTAGPCGAATFGRNVRPGELRSVAMQQVAHGADATVWFRWRTCTVGREQYWHGLLGHDGKALRRYREAAATADDMHKLAPLLEGTTVKSDAAIMYDYDSIWAMNIQPAYQGGDHKEAFKRFQRAFFRAGVNIDVVKPGDKLTGYKVVVAPHLYVLTDEHARSINEYVKAGGVFLADCRTAVKDEFNRCHERTLPGLLSPMLGISIEEYESIANDDEYRLSAQGTVSGTFTAVKYADWTIAGKAKALMGFQNWHMKEYAALTVNTYGKGRGYYLGTIVKEDSFYDTLIAALLADARIIPAVKPPAGVEISMRSGAGRRLMFVLNHTEKPQTVAVPSGKRELISGVTTDREITLDRFGVAVLLLSGKVK